LLAGEAGSMTAMRDVEDMGGLAAATDQETVRAEPPDSGSSSSELPVGDERFMGVRDLGIWWCCVGNCDGGGGGRCCGW